MCNRLAYFSDIRVRAIPLYVISRILTLNLLCYKPSAILMHDVAIALLPILLNIRPNQAHLYQIFNCGSFFTSKDLDSVNNSSPFLEVDKNLEQDSSSATWLK